jgi:hypothetical protein
MENFWISGFMLPMGSIILILHYFIYLYRKSLDYALIDAEEEIQIHLKKRKRKFKTVLRMKLWLCAYASKKCQFIP